MDDLIRRQDAINLLMKWSGGYDYIETETESAIKEFQDLPSAQQSIIATSNTMVSDTVEIPVMDGTTKQPEDD